MTIRRLILLALASLLPAAAFAAKVKPPAAVLREATTSLAAVEFAEAGSEGRMVFRRLEKLGGDAEMPELIDLAIPAELRRVVLPSERYLIAYTVFRREAEQIRVARLGAQLLVTPGLEPALLRDTPENRALIAWQPGGDEKAVQARLPELIALLDARDPQQHNFALSEIVLRPQLAEALDGRARKALLRFASRADANANARGRLLQAATVQPEHFGKDGWKAVALDILATTPVRVQDVDGNATLVRFAFELVERDRATVAPEVLERWLTGDNAALAEMALLRLRAQEPAREMPALERALTLSLLPAGTREFLLDHRRRAALAAQ
ncbi:MAG TPA: hypothetical protein VLF18_07500 [Tahibacter sp.]|uniref:hypothetical protein n=1 Tax=Tahibacter sp. TaxID=2056211 RepID=UPI002C9107B6|nr:hypothetical protein [Tahibacter sp.]HSX60026.1 hypothetical protein [Tahibacter sp.]